MRNLSLQLTLICLLLAGALSEVAAKEKHSMTVMIGSENFTATLADNPTATAFKAMLPLTLNMEDVNANEKVAILPAQLPTNDANPKPIEAGDLMIWTSRSLVLFYKSFSTSYSYTKVGRINDPASLSAALGSGKATITFELN